MIRWRRSDIVRTVAQAVADDHPDQPGDDDEHRDDERDRQQQSVVRYGRGEGHAAPPAGFATLDRVRVVSRRPAAGRSAPASLARAQPSVAIRPIATIPTTEYAIAGRPCGTSLFCS